MKNKKIKILLNKHQTDYLVRNLTRFKEYSGNDKALNEATKILASRLLRSLSKEDNVKEFFLNDVSFVKDMAKKSISILVDRTIPEYEKRNDAKSLLYVKKAEKTIKSLTALIKKIEKKEQGK